MCITLGVKEVYRYIEHNDKYLCMLHISLIRRCSYFEHIAREKITFIGLVVEFFIKYGWNNKIWELRKVDIKGRGLKTHYKWEIA